MSYCLHDDNKQQGDVMTIQQALEILALVKSIPQIDTVILGYGKSFIHDMYHNISDAMYALDMDGKFELADELAGYEAIWTDAYMVTQ